MPEIARIDFETGDFSQFDQLNIAGTNDLAIVSNPVLEGTHALAIINAGDSGENFGIKSFAANPSIHIRFGIFLPSTLAISGYLHPISVNGNLILMDVYSNLKPNFYFSGVGYTGDLPALLPDVFNIVDIYYEGDDPFGLIQVWLNGVLAWETRADTTGLIPSDIRLGNHYGTAETAGTFYIDDATVETWIAPAPPMQPPTASFSFTPFSPLLGEVITFDAGDSVDVDGVIVSYQWDFGDGTTGEGVVIEKTYGAEGEYTVTLTVTDNDGMTGQISGIITVYAQPPEPKPPVGWNLPLRCVGTKILNASGLDVTLKLTGTAIQGHEYDQSGTSRETNPAFFDYDAATIRSWGVRYFRVPFNKQWYETDPSYRTLMKQRVDSLASYGIVTQMDLHWDGGGQPPAGGMTEAAATALAYEYAETLKGVARDFLYQPMMIGVGVNEFWPLDDRQACWLWYMTLGNIIGSAVHEVNPDLLIFLNAHTWWVVTDATYQQSVGILTEPNVVMAIHNHSSAAFLGPGYWSGNDYRALYQAGDYAGGKALLYSFWDEELAPMQALYNIPFVLDEYSVDGNDAGAVLLADRFEYMRAHNWGSNYWTYFGPINCPDPVTCSKNSLLCSDWVTLQTMTPTFIEQVQLTIPPPPPQQHVLQVNSEPRPTSFTVTGPMGTIQGFTPQSFTLDEDTYTLEAPPQFEDVGQTYNFSQWTDDYYNPISDSPSIVLDLAADTSLRIIYVAVVPPPPAKGILQINAFIDSVEVVADGLIVETGQTFQTPITLELELGLYTVDLTYEAVTKRYTADVAEGLTTTINGQLAPPTPPPISPLMLIVPAGVWLLSELGKGKRRRG